MLAVTQRPGAGLSCKPLATIIHVVARPESSLAAEFVRAGHRVLEAVNLEQLVTVLRHYPNADLILIDADVKEGRERAAALGKIAIVLDPDATPNQVLRHIERLFPDKS